MSQGKILLINDEDAITRFLRDALTPAGYLVQIVNSARAGITLVGKEEFDLVLIKIKMPDMDGFQLIREIKRADPDSVIVVILEQIIGQIVEEIFKLGVYDYITKPINLEKLFLAIKKSADIHHLLVSHKRLVKGLEEQNTTLQKQNILLAKRIEESTKNLTRLYDDLRETYMRTIRTLAQAIDARDHYTHSHSENVTRYAVAIAEEMQLPPKQVELIREACQLHDLGKIGIPDYILSKPGELTPEEWVEIKKHSVKAVEILEPLTFLNGVVELIRAHHERFDGKGYPNGLKEEEIPLGARILCLSDAYEAMTSARSYRKIPLSKHEAVEEIKRNSGTQFDPKVVEVFLRIVDKL